MISEESNRNGTDGKPRFAAFSAYAVAGFVAVLAGYGLDLVLTLRNRGAELSLSPARRLAAVAHSVALLLPLVLVVAFVFTAAEWLAPAAARDVRRVFSLRTMFRRNPEALGRAVSFTIGFALSFVFVFRLASTSLELFHSPLVIAAVVGVLGPCFVIGASLLARRIEPAIVGFARGLDGASSPALFLATAAIALTPALFHLAEAAPELDRSIPWTAVRIVTTFSLVALVVASTLRDPPTNPWRLRRVGLPLLALVFASTATSIATYGRTTSQRALVEDLGWSSSLAYRFWSEVLDRDGDGYPSLLGGRDCNDERADIHPGAVDERGDRTDSDCFGGDGTPAFDDRIINPPSPPVLADGSVPNILLVSIDTMRPDRLGVLGNTRRITPQLDAFARDAVVFAQAECSSPRTTRSMPSIFTGQHAGRLPFERSLNRLDLDLDVETLAERMSTAYETAAVIGTSYFQMAPNILQGFGHVDQATLMKSDPRFPTEIALQWLTARRQTTRPFFLWVHYFAPHEPYLVDGTPSRFGPTPEGHYDTEIHRADTQVGRLLDQLRANGLDRNTVVIVFSDHGESLGDHGAWGHSTRLTEDQLRSVLMFRVPGIPGRIEQTPVALFDLHATILDLAGIRPSTPESARTLLPLMRGQTQGFVNRPLFGEILPDAVYAIDTQSVRRGNDKLIFDPRTGRLALFDLGSDPGEMRDLADTRPARAAELRDLLIAWDVASHRPENRTNQRIHDAHVRELPADAIRLDAHFANGITLVGAKLREARVARTGELVADLYFRAERPITSEYYIHFTYEPEDGGASLEAHHTALDGAYPTQLWRPGEMFRDTVVLRVPPHGRAGMRYVAQVELWAHFHQRITVAAQVGGTQTESVRFGQVTLE